MIEWIVSALIKDNTNTLEEYVKEDNTIDDEKRLQIFKQLQYITPFTISDDTLNFLIEIGNEYGYYLLENHLSYGANFERLKRVIPLVDHEGNIDNFIQMILRYANNYKPYLSFGHSTAHMLKQRYCVIEYINYLEDKLTLDDITEILTKILKCTANQDVKDVNSYVIIDILLYITFRVINNLILQLPEYDYVNSIIEKLAILSIKINSSQVLTETLLKHTNNPQEIINTANQLTIIPLPPNYTSFFSEDI